MRGSFKPKVMPLLIHSAENQVPDKACEYEVTEVSRKLFQERSSVARGDVSIAALGAGSFPLATLSGRGPSRRNGLRGERGLVHRSRALTSYFGTGIDTRLSESFNQLRWIRATGFRNRGSFLAHAWPFLLLRRHKGRRVEVGYTTVSHRAA